MESADYSEAIAYLSEQIQVLTAKQEAHHIQSWEKLDAWAEVNSNLSECLRGQAQEYQASISTYQALMQHLLTFASTTQQLTVVTNELGGSSERLVHYLMEEQALELQHLKESQRQLHEVSNQLGQCLMEEQTPRLESLKTNSEQLENSSRKLETYLKTEQSERLKLLEKSIRALLEMIEGLGQKNLSSPTGNSSAQNVKAGSSRSLSQNHPKTSFKKVLARRLEKKQSYSLLEFIFSVGVSSIFSIFIVIFLWNISSVGKVIVNIAERSGWSVTKIEKLEDVPTSGE
ncbi:MAG: hypothetical protein AB8B99_17575 [Phormidesmis sp.]